MRAKTCVCLGSGGGFIPRIMTQARVDLHDQKIFSGLKQMEWGDCGTTFIVDADNGVGGFTDWTDKRSFFRKNFDCRVILDTTENAFYNFFVKEDIKIDYLHIDAGHSYDDVKNDFTLYSSILSDYGVISIHDTDESFEKELIVTEDVKEKKHHTPFDGPSKLIKELKESNEWELFNFFNNGLLILNLVGTFSGRFFICCFDVFFEYFFASFGFVAYRNLICALPVSYTHLTLPTSDLV